MKKILKVLGILLLLVVIIVAGGATFISVRGIPSYDVNVPKIPQVEVTPARVERGAKIAGMLCKNCHYNPETGKLSGRELSEAPAFGKIFSKNITNDKESGIGKWTDAEIIYLIRTGIHPHTGKYVPPYMAKLVHIGDEDLNSIIAFLRSDNPLVQADPSVHPATEPSFLTKFLCMVAFKPYPFPDHVLPVADTTNQVAWGKYLALYQLECFTCHSADFKTMNVAEPEKSEGFFGGGNVLQTGPTSTITTLNLTPDEETGIGKWTEEDFVKAVKSGIVPNGPALRQPMQPYVQLTDEEAKAIYAYLRTVPKISNKVDRGI